MTPEDQRDYESIKKLLDRLGKAVIMSAETDHAEIIRRRLFDWSGLPDEAKKTAAAYAEWVQDHKQMIGDFDADAARERFLASLPVPPGAALGLRAEVAEPAPVPEDAGRAPTAGALGLARLRPGLQGCPPRPADRARDRPARRPLLPRRHVRATRQQRPGRPGRRPTSRARRTPTPCGSTARPTTRSRRPGCTRRWPRRSCSSPTAARPGPRRPSPRSAWPSPSPTSTSPTSSRPSKPWAIAATT